MRAQEDDQLDHALDGYRGVATELALNDQLGDPEAIAREITDRMLYGMV